MTWPGADPPTHSRDLPSPPRPWACALLALVLVGFLWGWQQPPSRVAGLNARVGDPHEHHTVRRCKKPAVAANGSWAESRLSSTQGKLWRAVKIRKAPGELLFQGEAAARVRPRPEGSVAGTTDFQNVLSCRNWAVVTTIFEPTELAAQLARVPEWCAVFVGDKKSPPKATWSAFTAEQGIVFLDIDAQLKLGYSINGRIAFNHFSRKNIGYLYAMQHGAQLVYDTDDDNFLLGEGAWLSALANSSIGSTGQVPVWRTSHHLANLNVWMGVRIGQGERAGSSQFTWPRGFPLPFIKDTRTSSQNLSVSARSIPTSQVGVIQVSANHDPDVDAIYRLTQPLPLKFDQNVNARVALPAGTVMPFNAQAAVFTRDAFWGLLLPATVHGRVADIWRSYFSQRLMWDIGLSAVFAGAGVTQHRNPHSYMADFNSEEPLYAEGTDLVHELLQWAPSAPTLPGRIEEMYVHMYEVGVLEWDDVLLTRAWLADLLHVVGYRFPAVRSPFVPREVDVPLIVDGRQDNDGLLV